MTQYPVCSKCGTLMTPVMDNYYYCPKCDEERISYDGEGLE